MIGLRHSSRLPSFSPLRCWLAYYYSCRVTIVDVAGGVQTCAANSCGLLRPNRRAMCAFACVLFWDRRSYYTTTSAIWVCNCALEMVESTVRSKFLSSGCLSVYISLNMCVFVDIGVQYGTAVPKKKQDCPTDRLPSTKFARFLINEPTGDANNWWSQRRFN